MRGREYGRLRELNELIIKLKSSDYTVKKCVERSILL